MPPGRPQLQDFDQAGVADDEGRCGQAVARIVTALGLKTAVLASGGMSHFPGTDRYSNPELNWDKSLLDKLAGGNLKALIGFDETELERAPQLSAHWDGV